MQEQTLSRRLSGGDTGRAITEGEIRNSLKIVDASKSARPFGLHPATVKSPAEVSVKRFT